MSERFDQLAAKHEQLRLRAELQRRQLSQASAEIGRRLARVDHGFNIVRDMVRRPVVVAAGVAVLAMLGPRRLMRWASNSAVLFSTARRLSARRGSGAEARLRGGG